MSIYDFYPMKKRRLSLCKTPNGGRSASTLGKLKKTSEQLTSTVESRIEVYWDNNSPSPTTTLALAGKRRRRRQNNCGDENNETTDISFVVQKLSENTSPVVDHPNSALLEMWVNKEQHGDDCDEEFTSPPNQTRHDKRKAVLATPLNQRRTSKRTTRKATRQFMLEIRKLVDEIQKSDINNLASMSQRDSQKDQEQLKRPELDEGTVSSTTNSKPSTLHKPEIHTKTDPEGGTDDSFEWTEDDMDELILTCQLSSSGKGSLEVPDAPRPHFGLSPSYILTHVPETQPMLSHDTAAAGKSHDTHESREDKSWEMNFGEDDSLLESAAQEFELSQKSPATTKIRRFPKGDDVSPKLLPSVATSLSRNPAAATSVSRVPSAAASVSRNPSAATSVPRVPSAATSVSRAPSAVTSVSRAPSAPSSVSRAPSAATSVSRNPSAATSVSRAPSAATSVSRAPSAPSSVSRAPSAATSVSRNPSAPSSVSRAPSAATSVSRAPSAATSVSRVPSAALSVSRVPSVASSVSRVPSAASSVSRGPSVSRVPSDATSVPRVPATAECRPDNGQNKNVLRSSHGNKVSEKSNRHRSPAIPSSSRHGDRTSVAPLNSTLENPMEPVKGHQMKSELHKNVVTPSVRQEQSTSTSLDAKHRIQDGRCDGKSISSDGTKSLPKDIECLLFGDNIAALFEDFNFEESLNVTTCTRQAPVPLSNTARKTNSDSGQSTTSSSQTKKAIYSKDEIERKRLQAQQRRLAKLRASSSRPTTRKPKMR